MGANGGTRDLGDLVRRLQDADDPGRVLLDLSLERAAGEDPDLPEAIRLAAVPRRFDPYVLGVLRDAGDQEARNEELVERIARHPFTRADGPGYLLHDTTRRLLLADWRATPESTERFVEVSRRLIDHYRALHQEAQELGGHLGFVSDLVRGASPSRYEQMVAAIEVREIPPLLEILHHETRISAEGGYRVFVDHFHQYESVRRLTVCERLVSGIRRELSDPSMDSDTAPLLAWVDYYQARLDRGFRRRHEARARLEHLTTSVTDRKLKLWVLSELGGIHHEEYRLREALRVFEEELELAVESQVDPMNIPRSHQRIAAVHSTLWDHAEASRRYRAGMEAARSQGRTELAYGAQLELVSALVRRGARDEALDVALDAYHTARVDATTDRARQRAVANTFMELLGSEDPRLLDTLFCEKLELLTELGDEDAEPDALLGYAELLRASGQLRRAEAVLRGLFGNGGGDPSSDADARKRAPTGGDGDGGLLLQWALLLEERGELDDSQAVYQRLLEQVADTPQERWNRAAALTNLGLIQRDRARFEEAVETFGEARDIWVGIGHTKLSAVCRLMDASARIVGVRYRRLEKETAGPGGRKAHETQLRAEMARLRAEWEEAAEGFRAADAEGAEGPSAAVRAGRLALVRGRQGRWAEAADWARAAAERWNDVADGTEVDPVVPDPGSEDELSEVEGLLEAADIHIDDDIPPWLADLHEARATLRAEQGRHAEAADHLALAVGLHELLRSYRASAMTRVALAEQLGAAGDPRAAGAAASAAAGDWRRLADHDAYEPAASAVTADSLNARGLWYLTRPDRPEGARTARDYLRDACRRVEDHCWYHLNLSYAAARVGEWAEAASALERAVQLEPALHGSRLLARRVTAYRIRRATTLVAAGDAQAGASLARAVAQLETMERDGGGVDPGLAELWIEVGDQELRRGRAEEAVGAYRSGLELAHVGGSHAHQSRLSGRLAWAGVLLGRTAWAASLLELARQRDPDFGAVSLVRELADTLSDRAGGLRVAAFLRGVSSDRTLPEDARDDAARARLELTRAAGDSILGGDHPGPGELPPPRPVLLQVFASAFSEHEEAVMGHPLFQRYLPELRERVSNDTGVRIPGVMVQAAHDLTEGTFVLSVLEVPRWAGRVEPDRLFQPDPPAGAEAAPRPEPPGRWLEPDEAAAEEGATPWDPFEYMARFMEGHLRRELATFVGVEEITGALDELASDGPEGLRGRAVAIREDHEALLDLVRTARALLDEELPLGDLATVVEAFDSVFHRPDRPEAAVEAARSLLRDVLPGNGEGQTFIRATPSFEEAALAGVTEPAGRRRLALDPHAAQALLQGVQGTVGDTPARDLTLVLEHPELRPLLARLLRIELPGLRVMSAQECRVPLERLDPRVALPEEGAPVASFAAVEKQSSRTLGVEGA